MKILATRWFTSSTLVGIVRVEDERNGVKYYIAGIPESSTEEIDAQHIADWGSTFPKDAGDVLFGVNK